MVGGPTNGKNPPANTLDFGLKSSQHWQSWSEMQEQVRFAEETGWDSVWAFDHFFSLTDGEMGDCLDGWTLLAAIAGMTERVQMGLLVTGLTHRPPPVLFKQVVTVDHISGGRLIFGVGASWNQREHEAYGLPFPSDRVRVDQFREAMEIYHQFESQERTTYDGEHFKLIDAPFEPKPVFGHIPILMGTTGKHMLRVAAQYADQWDARSGTVDDYVTYGSQLNANCAAIGRDPGEIRWMRHSGKEEIHLVGDVDLFRKHVHEFVKVGVRSFVLSVPRGAPDRTLREISEKTIPELRKAFVAGDLT